MRRMAVAVATLALVGGALTAPSAEATPRQSATACTTKIDKNSLKITPRPVIVPAKYWSRQVVTFRVRDSCLDANSTVDASVDYQTKDSEIGGGSAAATSENGHWFRATIEVYIGADWIDNEDAGWWHPDVWATGSDTDEALPPLFYVLRETQLTTNATPEPVQRKHTLTSRADSLGPTSTPAGTRPTASSRSICSSAPRPAAITRSRPSPRALRVHSKQRSSPAVPATTATCSPAKTPTPPRRRAARTM